MEEQGLVRAGIDTPCGSPQLLVKSSSLPLTSPKEFEAKAALRAVDTGLAGQGPVSKRAGKLVLSSSHMKWGNNFRPGRESVMAPE